MTMVRTITKEELKAKIERAERFRLVDVRDTPDYEKEHIPGAVHLLIAEMSREKAEAMFDKGDLIVTYSLDKDCPAKRIAARRLLDYGFAHVLAYEGSWKEWRAAGYPAERGTPS
jgi:rhodanese-related sulfurtransferase